ncbi:MAG: glycosyltransferase family 9 protein [Phycisphaerales bacterium]|nr:glycosyltransferase family 9 protein [Phycisphaerales bacterium]
MKISTMRFLDRLVGIPLCAMLTLWHRAVRLVAREHDAPVRRILFIKLAEQGSTVLAVSAIQRAIAMVGRANVYFMVFEENRFVLDLMDLIPPENVIAIRAEGWLGTFANTIAAVRRTRGLRIDAAVDLEFFARSSAALAYLSGAGRRIGFHGRGAEGPYRGNLMTHRLRYNPHLHTSETFRFMVDAIELDPTDLPAVPFAPAKTGAEPPPFRPASDELERVRRIVADAAGTESFRPLVLLNANCSDLIPLRAWPRDRYLVLARRLLASVPDLHIAFTGAPVEGPAAERLVQEIDSPRCFSLAGRTTLRELLVAFMHADVLVTNDSGPAHFASLTPIEVVALFGPEHPSLFGSRSPRSHILWAGLACSPCVSALNNRETPCRNNLCMQHIGVDAVHELVLRLLGEGARAGRSSKVGGAPQPERAVPLVQVTWPPVGEAIKR